MKRLKAASQGKKKGLVQQTALEFLHPQTGIQEAAVIDTVHTVRWDHI